MQKYEKHGRWEVLSFVQCGKYKKAIARCQCGKEKMVLYENLVRGKSLSCGCLRSELVSKNFKTHGKTKTSTYKSWAHMKGRCLNALDPAYKDYGGRGIFVCDRWMKFDNFYEDMGDCPQGFSIERINVEDGYHKDNCKWIEKNLQQRNTRKTVFTEEKIKTIREMLKEGVKTSFLAGQHNVGQGHIRQIRSNVIWKNI